MGFLKNLFSKKEKVTEPEVHPDIKEFGRMLDGTEDMCEYCRRPIFRDTEKWTKMQGHYFHRHCWKKGKKEA